MSSLSLNRLCNGNVQNKNKNLNTKFSTLPRKKPIPKIPETDLNNNTPRSSVQPVQPKVLNRRGSLHHNQFKGVKKELIERNASQIIHTMTVRNRLFCLA